MSTLYFFTVENIIMLTINIKCSYNFERSIRELNIIEKIINIWREPTFIIPNLLNGLNNVYLPTLLVLQELLTLGCEEES